MEPISITVATVVARSFGSAAGRQFGAQASQALFTYIRQRYQSAEPCIERLRNDPDSADCRRDLAIALQGLGADRDPELLALCQQLLDLAAHGVRSDPVEVEKHRTGVEAVLHVLDRHVERILRLRSAYHVENSDLLSGNVSRAPHVPPEVRTEVAELHARIRTVIDRVVSLIEESKYRDAERSVTAMTGALERARAQRLIEADRQLHVSYETLWCAVSFFNEVNQEILSRVRRESSPQQQRQLMFGNTIIVYEMADFVINFIADFSPGGSADLDALQREMTGHIKKALAEQDNLEKRASANNIEQDTHYQILENVQHRRIALAKVRAEWDQYADETRRFHHGVYDLRLKTPSLELIKDDAASQLSVLEIVSVLAFLRRTSHAAWSAVETMQGFRLAPLTKERVSILISDH
jgi:hypothetical protein